MIAINRCCHSAGIQTSQVDAIATIVIQSNAKKLKRRPEFCTIDLEDLQQELWTALLEALPSHDPAIRPLKTFIEVVVDRRRISMIRTQNCEKRDPSRVAFSLDDEVAGDGEARSREATFLHKATEQRRRQKQDIHDALLDAPEHLREAAPAFACKSISSIAKAKRITEDKARYYRAALRIRLSDIG